MTVYCHYNNLQYDEYQMQAYVALDIYACKHKCQVLFIHFFIIGSRKGQQI